MDVRGGAHYKLSPQCRLIRGNPQWPGDIDLLRKYKISWFIFLVSLTAQSTRCNKSLPDRIFKRLKSCGGVELEALTLSIIPII